MESVKFGARLKNWTWLAIAVVILLISKTGNAAITDGKFGINQIFDVQYWWNGTTLNASNFIAPYNKNFQTVTVTTGQYFQFFDSTTNPGKHGLKLMNSNGTQHSIVHDHGDITALGNGAIFYIGSGFFGNVITTAQGYSYGSSASFTNMDTSVTSTDLNNYTYASSTPLAAGQTAAPPAPTVNWQPIRTTSSPVVISNIYPTSNNSPAGEGATQAFDGNSGTKYLNFDKKNAGVTVKLSQGRVVQKFTLTTANDFSGRDPTSYKLYGSNDGVNWTLIKQDTVTLSEQRFWTSPEIMVANTNPYVYYFILFPTTKSGDGCGLNCDSMQIAEVTFYYDLNDGVTSTEFDSGSTPSNPGTSGSICADCSPPAPACPNNSTCSDTSFNANTGFANRANIWSQQTGNRVIIEQVGNYNTATIQQSGSKNYVEIDLTGSNNSTTVTQTTSNAANYIEALITGNSNTVNLIQNGSGGTRGIMAIVNNNLNNLTVDQSGAGNHYAEINLGGGNKTADVTQNGTAGHMVKIELTGGATSITTTQSGSTQQFYSITHNCAQASCAAITVTQGQ